MGQDWEGNGLGLYLNIMTGVRGGSQQAKTRIGNFLIRNRNGYRLIINYCGAQST
jgi:hypothetical protein